MGSKQSETNQHLTFTLDNETYALDISQVREVLDFTSVTRVPRLPEYIMGVINLRGGVVPVVDMRLKLGLPAGEKTVDTSIIIVEVSLDGEQTILGAVVDSVQEVLELDAEDMQPPPKMGIRLNTDFIRGMGKQGERFIIMLHIDRIFSAEEITIVRQASEDAGEEFETAPVEVEASEA